MKVFIRKLKDIIGRGRNSAPMSNSDVVFNAQLHFLMRNFDRFAREVTVVDGGSPGTHTFKFRISTRGDVCEKLSRIVYSDWGDFEVVQVEFCNRNSMDIDLEWLAVAVTVAIRG